MILNQLDQLSIAAVSKDVCHVEHREGSPESQEIPRGTQDDVQPESLSINKPSFIIRSFNETTWVFLTLAFLLLIRLMAMDIVPLNDSTEARYAEIARLMLQSNDWITPMHQSGIPFWAKPPLSTWLSAASMNVFGINPFAARLPAFLLSLAILWMVWQVAKTRSGLKVANLSLLVLAASCYFLLDAGTVMTDPALLFCTTLTFIAFWHAISNDKLIWGYLFFVALGLGLLAKGPVALVLTGLPIISWVFIQRKWRLVWPRLPWITGSLIMMVIALPWYVLAERKTPGFLNYFIIGEHINRFLQPGWVGDKYGSAHLAPLGMIWVYALVGIFPWSIPGVIWLKRHYRALPTLFRDTDGWVRYLLLCTLMPLLFFTFAKNIIYPYVFPCLPTFALLFAELAHRTELSVSKRPQLLFYAIFTGIALLGIIALFIYQPDIISKSQDRVVKLFEDQQVDQDSQLVYWAYKPDYSAQFYSSGRAIATLYRHELCLILSNHAPNFVVIDPEVPQVFPPDILSQLTEVGVVPVLKKNYRILRADDVKCD